MISAVFVLDGIFNIRFGRKGIARLAGRALDSRLFKMG